MTTTIGQEETEIGTVNFVMNAGNLELRTYKTAFTVYDDDIKEIDGKFYYTIPETSISGFGNVREIEIPADVLKRRDEILEEVERMKGNLCKVETAQGNVYFSIGEKDQIIIKHAGKTIETNNIYTVEGKRVICLPELGFIEVPSVVEYEIKRIQNEREARARGLVYAGRSLLTGLDYFKFNYDLGNDAFNRVKDIFIYFEPGEVGSLEGWVTAKPELAEERLRIRNSISSRIEEIEKQKEQAVKANKKLIEKLMKAA